jgi:phosphopantetheinyl transferase (holo-ACP synthase)
MPLIHVNEIKPGVKTGLWRILEPKEELLEGLDLSDREQAGYDLLKTDLRMRQWLSYRNMICQILESPKAPVHNDANGKPIIQGHPFHVSISHTDDYSAVILSDRYEVGIDIEKLRPRILKVKEKFLSDNELEMTRAGGLEKPTILWCAKEALYKLYGRRNLDFRKHISLDNFDLEQHDTFGGTIQVGDTIQRYRLNWERLGELILVYVIEDTDITNQ